MTKIKVTALLKKLLPCNTGNEFMTSLSHNLVGTEDFILDAETRGEGKNFIDWLRDARGVCEEARDLVDEFDYRSATSSSSIDRFLIDVEFRPRSQVVNGKLKQIHEKTLNFKLIPQDRSPNIDASEELGRETSSILGSDKVYGRDKEIADLENMLLHENDVNVCVISVVGLGGMGKTFLAQKIFNGHEISYHFHVRGWVCVSQNSSITKVVKDIISSLTGKDTNVDDGLDTLLLHLRSVVEGSRFLLVLDDVWDADRRWWESIQSCFANAAKGSRILVTTRNQEVARSMGSTKTYPLKGLSPEACRDLFEERAFRLISPKDRKRFEPMGKEIVAKCDGLPLALKVVGDLLMNRSSPEEWKNVLDQETFVASGTIFPVLQLSYNHLGTKLKQCLAYCSIFPKDHSIETDTLVKLWMAQGYLKSSRNEPDMEKIGYSILQKLQMRSFFQDSDNRIDNKTCKIHGTVHDFLLSLLKMECVISKVDRVTGLDCKFTHPKEARHSTFVIATQSSLPVSVCSLGMLRTLVILSDYASVSTGWLRQLFEHLRLLRALHFSCCSIEQIPTQLGKLYQLRYLNLSYNRNLKELPETVCDLYNLQTLNLDGCDHLEKLPEGIGKLTNLRHLEILWTLSLRFLPKGICKLSSLRTLNRFIVSPGSGNKAFTLGELEKLEKLEGYLYIDGLADLTDVNEARRASLNSKEGLCGLDLWFSGAGTDKDNMRNVLEALRPPWGLKYLGIHYYGGTVLPTWMSSLSVLTYLVLFACTNCESFRCVATLPSLKTLEIRDMPNVEELSFDVKVSGTTPFPKLNRLCIYNMKRLKDWEVTVRGAADSTCPSLRQLSIGNCPELQALPLHLQAATLKELSVSECPKLNEWLNTIENQDKVSHIPNIKIDDQDVQKAGRRSSHLASSSSSVNRTFTRVRSSLGQGF